jgi:PTS system glucitol/sorbitol-specific IIC component
MSGKKMLPVLKKLAPPLLVGASLFIVLFWLGLGELIGRELAALTGPVLALVIIFAACLIPALSPVLGSGLLIAIAAGILTGEQIAGGAVTPVLALAALLSVDAQLGGSFIPAGLALGENEPETISAGVPGIVFTRLITVPVAVVLACLFSFLPGRF